MFAILQNTLRSLKFKLALVTSDKTQAFTRHLVQEFVLRELLSHRPWTTLCLVKYDIKLPYLIVQCSLHIVVFPTKCPIQ